MIWQKSLIEDLWNAGVPIVRRCFQNTRAFEILPLSSQLKEWLLDHYSAAELREDIRTADQLINLLKNCYIVDGEMVLQGKLLAKLDGLGDYIQSIEQFKDFFKWIGTDYKPLFLSGLSIEAVERFSTQLHLEAKFQNVFQPIADFMSARASRATFPVSRLANEDIRACLMAKALLNQAQDQQKLGLSQIRGHLNHEHNTLTLNL